MQLHRLAFVFEEDGIHFCVSVFREDGGFFHPSGPFRLPAFGHSRPASAIAGVKERKEV